MKKRRHIYALATSLIIGSIAFGTLTGCGSEISSEGVKIVVQTEKTSGKVGETIQLSTIVIGDEKAKVFWESLDVAIATVDQNGLVTLNNPGTALIQASIGKNKEIKSTPIQLTCVTSSEVTKILKIVSEPSVKKYKTGSALSFDGLKIMGFDSYDGIIDNLSGVEIPLSELQFSTKEGTSLTSKGKLTITVSCTNYQSVSFEIEVQDVVVVNALKVTNYPTKSKYLISKNTPAVFDSTGLRVSLYTYEDNVFKKSKLLDLSEINLSIPSGTKFTREGDYSIEVTHKTNKEYLSDTFSVKVLTEDLTIKNLISTLQKTKNYQIEILNNVGTNNDATGFHYLRTYTEKYFDEVEYQNIIDTTTGKIEFSKDKVKQHIGYTGYKNDITGEKSIIAYGEDHLKRIVGKNIITTTSNNWWDKASSLTTLPTIFDLTKIPTETINGNYLSVVIKHEPNDTTGDATIVKYPLIEQFLQFCGWSSNLITIMSRFEIKIENEYELSMKAFMGSYGTTELKVTGLGDCAIDKVEKALSKGSIVPNKEIDKTVLEIADKLRGDYAVRLEYGDNGIDKTNKTIIFHKDYYFDALSNIGFVNIDNAIYSFKGKMNPSTQEYSIDQLSKEPVTASYTDVSKYVATLQSEGAIIYPKDGFKDIIGTYSDDKLGSNTLNTFSLYNAFSSESDKCYQSFDDSSKKSFEKYLLGGQSIENGRLWFLTHYATNPQTQENEIETIEAWDIDLTKGSGYVIPLGCFSKEEATLKWVEDGVAAIKAVGALNK